MSEGASSAPPTAEALSREAIARIDPSGQLDDVPLRPIGGDLKLGLGEGGVR